VRPAVHLGNPVQPAAMNGGNLRLKRYSNH
jgi:hypothetical protein